MPPSLILTVLGFVAFIVVLTVHEYSHALVGYLEGDETARRYGRLSLNPLVHIDPVGTIVIPLLGSLGGIPLIGWAKPVPFNPYNLKHGKWGAVAVALAGPGSNIVLAAVALGGFFLVMGPLGLPAENLLVVFLSRIVMISLALAVFNLLPVPPLDGSRLVTTLLDKPQHQKLRLAIETRGPIALLLIVFADFALGGRILGPVFSAFFNAFFWMFGMK